MNVLIVNYGMGNIYSIQNALNFLGVENEYSDEPVKIMNADKIILPGVGSYKKAMHNIVSRGIDLAIIESALTKKTPILGICLGMQILGKSGTEEGFTKGLGLFDGVVEKFDFTSAGIKIPHVGFNEVKQPIKTNLYQNINDNCDFYFVHSYKMRTSIKDGIAYCFYGENFVASFEQMNIFGTQFHPEKSQINGLMLLKNFLMV